MCISKQYLCDLHYDCPHEDDEQNCTNSGPFEEIECTKFEFQCLGDHMCLPLEMVCDGVPQCLDGTDESMGCLDIEKSCTGGFLCKNRHCLTNPEWVCDGVDDCGDNSDEEANCSKHSKANLPPLIGTLHHKIQRIFTDIFAVYTATFPVREQQECPQAYINT